MKRHTQKPSSGITGVGPRNDPPEIREMRDGVKIKEAEILDVCGQTIISKREMQMLSPDAIIRCLRTAVGDTVIQVTSFVAAMPKERIDVYKEWPKTWWDAFKLRWFPAWALKRWPAKFDAIWINEQKYGPICPHLSTQEKRHHLRWMEAGDKMAPAEFVDLSKPPPPPIQKLFDPKDH